MADALSRRHNLLSKIRITVPGFDSFMDLYATDPFFATILLKIQNRERTDFLLQDGFLFHGLQLCIPMSSLRFQIIQELHNEGHVGRDRTLHLVSSSYFWPSMRKEVDRFVARCRSARWPKDHLLMLVYTFLSLFLLSLGQISAWTSCLAFHVHSGEATPFLWWLTASPKWRTLYHVSAHQMLLM